MSEDYRTIVVGSDKYGDRCALVDASDFDVLNRYRWSLKDGYAARFDRDRGKAVSMHREIVNPPDGLVVDHLNGHRLDNRRSNLRACTPQENARNLHRHCRECDALAVPDTWYCESCQSQRDRQVAALQPESPMCTIKDIAERLNVSAKTIRRWLQDGKIDGFRIGGSRARWRIPASAFSAYLEKQRRVDCGS